MKCIRGRNMYNISCARPFLLLFQNVLPSLSVLIDIVPIIMTRNVDPVTTITSSTNLHGTARNANVSTFYAC